MMFDPQFLRNMGSNSEFNFLVQEPGNAHLFGDARDPVLATYATELGVKGGHS